MDTKLQKKIYSITDTRYKQKLIKRCQFHTYEQQNHESLYLICHLYTRIYTETNFLQGSQPC